MNDKTHSVSLASANTPALTNTTRLNSTSPSFKPLNVSDLILSQRHLIEASAGTGKTYNITRIAIKVLLQKAIPINELLIVTFTKAATQELKARIATTLHEFIEMLEGESSAWDELLVSILSQTDAPTVPRALDLLKLAVFQMDEAAIFTINSFCGRMLKQSSFLTRHPFDQAIIDDSETIYIESIQDWFRQHQSQPTIRQALQEFNVESPDKFFNEFKTILFNAEPVLYPAQHDLDTELAIACDEAFVAQGDVRAQCVTTLQQYHGLIEPYFSKHKDPKKHGCFAAVVAWCEAVNYPGPIADFTVLFNGNAMNSYLKSLPSDEFTAVKTILTDCKNTIKATILDLPLAYSTIAKKVDCYPILADAFTQIKAQASIEKRRQGVLDHTDTVMLLSQQIVENNSALIALIRQQYPVALIDEFQDTDAAQYAIFDTVYPRDDATLMLLMIGDPKQAIYGFRGGDVFTYLAAVNDACFHWNMDTNFRSTDNVIKGYNTLFYGLDVAKMSVDAMSTLSQTQPLDYASTHPEAQIFDQKINYTWIQSTIKAKANANQLVDPISQAGTHIFAIENSDSAHPVMLKSSAASQLMARWVANEVGRLFDQVELGQRKVRPADIAVLVNTRKQGMMMQKVFASAGHNSVILSDKTSIFSAQQAHDLYYFLHGILNFNQQRAFKAMLGTDLMGIDKAVLIELDDHEQRVEQFKLECHQLQQQWLNEGILAMLTGVLKNRFRLSSVNGNLERTVSNYIQLGEILNEHERKTSMRAMTVEFLHHKIAEENTADAYCQRLESDAALIKIVTIHGAKGLEYPIVFVPFDSFGKNPTKGKTDSFLTYFDETKHAKIRYLAKTPVKKRIAQQQAKREAFRLLYVAMTRAANRCYIGYQNIHHHADTAIHSVFNEPAQQSDKTPLEYMQYLASRESDYFAYSRIDYDVPLSIRTNHDSSRHYAALSFSGNTYSQWQIFSYSKLLKQHTFADLNETNHADDTPDKKPKQPVPDNAIRFTLKKGAEAGNLLHNIMEYSDFTQPVDRELVKEQFTQCLPSESDKLEDVQEWIEEVLHTPILNSASGSTFTLSQIPLTNTLKEPQFYFPLTQVGLSTIHALLASHRGSPILTKQLTASINGMMQGFIDLIFEHEGQYFVCDYKSTYLGNTLADYTADKLRQNIESHDYDLQYLIYTWVLHKMLSQRLDNYDPAIHLGGVYYFYLRGMSVNGPEQSGIYYRQITTDDIAALSAVFSDVTDPDPADSHIEEEQ